MSMADDTTHLRAAKIELGSWGHAVACLVGPRHVRDPSEHQKRQAVQIAVAALQLAGRSDLAALVQSRA